MIKRTLHFGNPVYLSLKQNQLVVTYPNAETIVPRAKRLKQDQVPDTLQKTVPIEDVGVVILEHPQITITNALLDLLTTKNVAIINCDQRHMPIGLLQPLEGHSLQSERIKHQINASVPLKKNLWQQTIQAKINNQAAVLNERFHQSFDNMSYWAKQVTSGDVKNHEARAAAFYWQTIFDIPGFTRYRTGLPPNNLLNYGYAILRAITARALVSSGLFPTMGIHHHNKYNAFCLADDIMEPYRPYVDALVCHLFDNYDHLEELTIELKKELLSIPVLDVMIEGKKSPLLIAMSRTTNSLVECFMGVSRKLIYPKYV
ncbi:MAG: type II CRISPR-associated endonuclease Cas1 [Putridiphycobacter sp.]